MYRRALVTWCQGRSPVVFAQDVCLYYPKSNETANLRVSRTIVPGVCRTLTAGTPLFSKDPDELPSQDATQRRDTKEAERQEEGKPERPGKEKLLEILGQMKVEVVSKKPKVPQEEGRSRPHPAEMESTISMFQEATAGVSQQREKLSPKLVAAASAAAASLPDSARAESELLQQLRRHEAVTQAQKATDGSHIGNIIANMKVGRRPPLAQTGLRNPLDDEEDEHGGRRKAHSRGVATDEESGRRKKMQLGGKRLNIFTQVDAKAKEEVAAVPAPLTLSLWDVEFANTIGTVVNTLPRNGFEEMIEWTKEGKLWKYPIDNEAGLEEEAQVPFQEHIFLEKHLDEGFPKQGPVRHFMELVVSGLARNPYLTVAQKAEHIAWYREYFQSKEDLLREAGAC
ncbi:small ribosomal subunit protein mS31 [Scleropages formosus]|nr:28S ribosomal protein S31, mitochondrial [Scleropages formosus]